MRDYYSKYKSKESLGWLALMVCMFAFPVLFFLAVFLPIWLGLESPLSEIPARNPAPCKCETPPP